MGNSDVSYKSSAKTRHPTIPLNYLPPAGREIIKRIPCVCACVIECVSHFYKGLYITLVVSPWPFQCFL